MYTRGKLLKDGGEGYIYEVNEDPNLLLKIYKEYDAQGSPIVTPELQSKLEFMKNNPPETLIAKGAVAWPIDFITDEKDKLVGFIMPKLTAIEHLQLVYTYRHPQTDAEEYAALPSIESRVTVAINLCSALHELHKRGYVVGDFNHANIGVNYDTGQIGFFDCDSFHITDNDGNVFRTNVIMAGYLAPEIIKHCNAERAAGNPYNLDKVSLPTFSKESDLFCLAVHIFKLLMNGVDPFRGIKFDAEGSNAAPFVGNEAIEHNAYVFGEKNKPSAKFCPPASSLPPVILELFNDVFIIGRVEPSCRPDAASWYNALINFLDNDLTQCPINKKHQYYQKLPGCPYCAADDRYIMAINENFLPAIEKNLSDDEKPPQKDPPQAYKPYDPPKPPEPKSAMSIFWLIFLASLIITSILVIHGISNRNRPSPPSTRPESEGTQIWPDDSYVESQIWPDDPYPTPMPSPTATITPTPAIPEQANGTVTIMYNANGGSGAPPSHNVTKNEWGQADFNLSSTIPTRNGFDFIGWRLENDTGFNIDNPGQYIIFGFGDHTRFHDETMVYFAQWVENTPAFIPPPEPTQDAPVSSTPQNRTIIINYDANGGIGAPPSHNVAVDNEGFSSWHLPNTVPTRTGHTFNGWMHSGLFGAYTFWPGQDMSAYHDDSWRDMSMYAFVALWIQDEVTPTPEPIQNTPSYGMLHFSNGRFTGFHLNGQFISGVYVWFLGDVFEGEWLDGGRTLRGTAWFANGFVFTGDLYIFDDVTRLDTLWTDGISFDGGFEEVYEW
jgi:serine/threonine protein kinase